MFTITRGDNFTKFQENNKISLSIPNSECTEGAISVFIHAIINHEKNHKFIEYSIDKGTYEQNIWIGIQNKKCHIIIRHNDKNSENNNFNIEVNIDNIVMHNELIKIHNIYT
jgi:phospho-2-dehydro-3-deoxyheptonate aldolase